MISVCHNVRTLWNLMSFMMNNDVVQFLQVLSCSLLNGCKLISKQELMIRSWSDGARKLPKEGEGKETVIDIRTIVTVILMLLLGMETTILFVHNVSIFRGLKNYLRSNSKIKFWNCTEFLIFSQRWILQADSVQCKCSSFSSTAGDED